MRVTTSNTFTVHEMRAATGTTIREFVSPSGKVFGVAWDGPTLPDLRQVLGDYFPTYVEAAQAAQKRRAGHGPVRIEAPTFVVEQSGHLEGFLGTSLHCLQLVSAWRRHGNRSLEAVHGAQTPFALSHVIRHFTLVMNPDCGSELVGTPQRRRGAGSKRAADHREFRLQRTTSPTDYFSSVTICGVRAVHRNCRTIDGVLVDTGSSGLRITLLCADLDAAATDCQWHSDCGVQSIRGRLYMGAGAVGERCRHRRRARPAPSRSR